MKIAYLCNKTKECKDSRSCGTLCNHTLDAAYAVNGICLDPEHDERFENEMGSWVEKLPEDDKE